MTGEERNLRIDVFARRLAVEFPDWTADQARHAAARIVDTAAEWGAQLRRERMEAEWETVLMSIPLVEQ